MNHIPESSSTVYKTFKVATISITFERLVLIYKQDIDHDKRFIDGENYDDL